jgi:hypothetical protein
MRGGLLTGVLGGQRAVSDCSAQVLDTIEWLVGDPKLS